MEKNTFGIIVICFIVSLFLIGSGTFIGYYILGSGSRDRGRIGSDTDRERQLLEQLGEFERREQDRISAEQDRIGRENSRIERERKRIEDVENQLAAVRGLDRRSTTLLEQLGAEIEILSNYLRGVSIGLDDYDNYSGGE